jgi:hypothetical protein
METTSRFSFMLGSVPKKTYQLAERRGNILRITFIRLF